MPDHSNRAGLLASAGAVQTRQRHLIARHRQLILARLKRWLDPVMALLGFVWLALLVGDLLHGLNPFLLTLGNVIWAVFVLDFVAEIGLAPKKLPYLRHNWLTVLSLMAPALRMLRIVRLARLLRATRVARGLRLLRIVSSVNRGLKSLGAHMSRRGFPYVVALTLLVALAASAGMYAFEREVSAPNGLHDFGSALWWTAMLLTTMGSDYSPHTPEGRVLCLMLALYAFTVFGYVTAALASFFVGRDAENGAAPTPQAPPSDAVTQLLVEVAALRQELQALRNPVATGADNTGSHGVPPSA